MNKLTCLLGMALLLAGGSAFAQIDPDQDSVGFYADTEATIYCGVHPVGDPTMIYIILANPSAPGGVFGWECEVQYPTDFFILHTNLHGAGQNTGGPGEYIVGLPVPFPWAPTIVLATLTVLVQIPDCMWIYMGPIDNPSIPGEMVYADGADPGHLIPMRGSTGGPDSPVYGVNCDCPPPIPNLEATWGAVKVLYD